MGFITGTEIVLIPAVTAYDLWGGYTGAFSAPATQLSGNSTLYDNYAIVNGSIHNSNNPGINQDVYSAGARIEVTIPYTDFNNLINFRLYADNLVGSAAGDLYQGAISNYNFSAMPAAEIAGKISLNFGSYKTADPTNTYINIEQSVVQGSTIYNTIYQVAPQRDGSYRFFAAPNTVYSVWGTYVTPYGYVNSTDTSLTTGPPGGYNIPQWQNANICVNATSLGGKVILSNGSPIAGATVTASLGKYESTAVTDASGYYQFNDIVKTGTYTISTSYEGLTQSTTVDVSSLNTGEIVAPSDVLYYVPVTIENTQQYYATNNTYDQPVTVDSNSYSSYLAPNLQNVEWFTVGGTVIPSWIESGNSNTATNTVYWLKMPFGLVEGGSATIYMGITSPSINLLSSNGNEGEAPQLSAAYGQYDNGANIFHFYDNFAGSSLSSKWISGVTGSSSVTVNNGLKLFGEINYNHAYVESKQWFPSNTYVQGYLQGVTVQSGAPGIYPLAASTTTVWVGGTQVGSDGGLESSYVIGDTGSVSSFVGSPGTYNGAVITNTWTYPGYYGLQWQPFANVGGETLATLYNGAQTGNSTDTTISPVPFSIASWIQTGGAGQAYDNIGWISASPGFPNGVPPSYSIGTETGLSGSYQASDLNFPTYYVNFTSNGANGLSWSVNLNGATESTTSSSISFHEFPGTYSYSVGVPSGYSASPSGGTVSVGSSSVSVVITFTPTAYYTVTFSESGLSSGTTWSAKLAGVLKSTNAPSSISFSEPNGYFSFSIPPTGQNGQAYYGSPSSGTVSVNGGNANYNIAFKALNSVSGNTKILLANGTYALASKVSAGMDIMTYSTTSRSLQVEKVLGTQSDNRTVAYLINGELNISRGQEVWTSTGWVTAQNLSLGEKILDPLIGKYIAVKSIDIETGKFTMYGFDIAVTEDYVALHYVLYEH